MTPRWRGSSGSDPAIADEEPRDALGRGRHRADVIERRLDHGAAGIGHQAERGLEPEDAGPRGGEADRAALVAADRHVGLARGQHHGAAAGGAAGIVRGVMRVAHRPVVAGVPGAGERERLAIGGADDRPARIENAGDDGRIDVGHEAVEQARSDRHRDAGDARDVLHGHALPREHAAGRARDVAAPVPAVERVVLGPRPPAAVAGIFQRRLRLGELLQLAGRTRSRPPSANDSCRHRRR